jgi:glycosyltransferase involved in cell wall biosynthesis
MRILLLNEYFPPDTAATAKVAAALAETLAEVHQVTVLVGRPSYDPSTRHPYYLRRREKQGNLVIERVGSTAAHRRSMRGRLANYLSYLSLAVLRGLMIPADLIVAMTDPPVCGVAGAVVACLRRLPFVYSIQDLYPDMALAGGIVKPARWVDRWERLHRWALKRAARVTVLGDDMRELIIAKGVAPERVVVVRTGAQLPEFLPAANHPVVQEIRSDFRFVVLHAGNIGFAGAWETLLQAARLLENEGVGFIFVGDGALRPRLEAAAAGCRAVRFLPFRPPDEIPLVLAAGDLQVVTLRRGLEGVVVPSKMYPVLAAGRPVLAVTPPGSEVARIVHRHGCGLIADPDDPAAVAAAVRQVCSDRTQLTTMGQRARQAARDFEAVDQLRLFRETVEDAVKA